MIWLLEYISTGPRLQASIKTIEFYLTRGEICKKHVFEMKNASDVPAQFLFDISNNGVFSIDKFFGTIQPRKHMYFTVYFCPKKFGDYCENLNCLVMYQEPVIVKAFGSFRENLVGLNNAGLLWYQQDSVSDLGFSVYMADCAKFCSKMPPISLSETFLDFGMVSLEKEYVCNTLTTSLTNHMKSEIKVIWDNSKFT